MLLALVEMVSANLFRALPPSPNAAFDSGWFRFSVTREAAVTIEIVPVALPPFAGNVAICAAHRFE